MGRGWVLFGFSIVSPLLETADGGGHRISDFFPSSHRRGYCYPLFYSTQLSVSFTTMSLVSFRLDGDAPPPSIMVGVLSGMSGGDDGWRLFFLVMSDSISDIEKAFPNEVFPFPSQWPRSPVLSEWSSAVVSLDLI